MRQADHQAVLLGGKGPRWRHRALTEVGYARDVPCSPSASRLVLRSHTLDPGTPSMSAASEAASRGGTLGEGGSEAALQGNKNRRLP